MELKNVTRLLQINSSIFGEMGASTRLADRFVALWQAMDPRRSVVVRDLAKDPIPHLNANGFAAFAAPAELRTEEQNAILALSNMLIDELRAADIVVIGAPMYNLQISSGLKAYFDHVARAGVTFRYTVDGAVGLLLGKRAVIVTARGGVLTEGTDPVVPYISNFLGFLGFNDILSICAEGLQISEDTRTAGLEHAENQLQETLKSFS